VDDSDVRDLARLHASCLPDSLITALGAAFTRSFYRYVATSPHELLEVERNSAGRVIAAAVVTLRPATLNRRLLMRTTLLLAFLPRAFRLLRAAGSSDGAHAPEMILLFTAAEARRQGCARSLVGRVERQLRERGVREYVARTEADPANAALAFYRRQGFTPQRLETRLGVSFQVFSRTLGEGQ
jgi:ribosomal protein S18 acetylase RimI-like enzyme